MKLEPLSVIGFEQVVKAQLTDQVYSIIAIHNTKRGPALGGVRFYPYQDELAALYDVTHLAETMTYKAALADLPFGGGKSVIVGDPKTIKTPELMEKFGRFVEALQGKYITAKDVGVTLDDVDIIATQTKHVAGTTKGGSGDPSLMTAFGVYQGIKACAEFFWKNSHLKGRRVVVQGLGGVGWELARLLKEEGSLILACDLNPLIVEKAVREMGIETVLPSECMTVAADIFAPCALGQVIQARTISQLSAHGLKIIAGAANNPLNHEQADGWRLHRELFLYAPDFVINAGGLINVACELSGYDVIKARHQTEKIYSILLEIFRRSKKEDRPTSLIAHEMALEKVRAGSQIKIPRIAQRFEQCSLVKRGVPKKSS